MPGPFPQRQQVVLLSHPPPSAPQPLPPHPRLNRLHPQNPTRPSQRARRPRLGSGRSLGRHQRISLRADGVPPGHCTPLRTSDRLQQPRTSNRRSRSRRGRHLRRTHHRRRVSRPARSRLRDRPKTTASTTRTTTNRTNREQTHLCQSPGFTPPLQPHSASAPRHPAHPYAKNIATPHLRHACKPCTLQPS